MSLFRGENPDLNNVTVAGTLAVATADDLTVGGKIMPQTWTVTVPHMQADGHVYIAPRACKVVSIKEVHNVGASSATLAIRKITDASAPAATAGTTVKECLATALALDSTVDTVVTGSLNATAANYTLAAGNKLSFDYGGTLTGLNGVVVIELQAV